MTPGMVRDAFISARTEGGGEAGPDALDGALQALTEYGSALAGSGSGGLGDRIGRLLDLIGREVGEVVAFALEHPAPTTLGVAVFVILAVLWAISLR